MKSKSTLHRLFFKCKSFSQKLFNYTSLKAVCLTLVLLLISLISSCESEENPADQCDTQIEELTNILLDKSTAFGNSSSVSNCQEYKTAYLNLYNKMNQCGYPTTSLDADYQFVQSLDCSIFDSGTGGGTATGTAMIWTQIDHGCGVISVSINGTTKTISSYYSSGSPSCGATGCANFTLSPGTYSVSASCSGSTWNGTVTVSSGGCYKLKLT